MDMQTDNDSMNFLLSAEHVILNEAVSKLKGKKISLDKTLCRLGNHGPINGTIPAPADGLNYLKCAGIRYKETQQFHLN